jgi:hypothetical protein
MNTDSNDFPINFAVLNILLTVHRNTVYQYSKTNEMQFLYSVYYELTTSTYFEHYLLIFRRRSTNNNWYIACVLCLFHSNPGGNRHNTHAVYQLLFV